MDIISEENYRDYDLDWFFKIGDGYFHAASAGGELPEAIIRHFEKYSEIMQVVSRIPSEYEPIIDNQKILEHLQLGDGENQEGYDAFVLMFKGMAMKGFYSFDKQRITDPDDNNYILVAEPDLRLKTKPEFFELDGLIPCFQANELDLSEPIDLFTLVSDNCRVGNH